MVLVYGLIEVDTVDRNQTLIGLLFPFVTILAGLLLCTFYLHKRPIHSLFNAFNGFRISRLFFGFFTWLVLCGLSDVVYYYFVIHEKILSSITQETYFEYAKGNDFFVRLT